MEKQSAAQILRDDHKRIRGLFRQLTVLPDRSPEMEPGIAEQLYMELEIHAVLEEEIFYPAVLTVAPEELRAAIQESVEAHHQIDAAIQELRSKRPGGSEFTEKMNDLRRSALVHFEQEEAETLPAADWTLGHLSAQLVDRLQSRRRDLESQARYRTAQPQVAQNPHGGEQKRKVG